MRSERWWQDTSVTQSLFDTPTSFEFIQSIRLLRHVPYQQNLKFWADDFSFESSLNLNFPKSEIENLSLVDDRVEIRNLIAGLTGIQGALPYAYTNKIKQAPRKYREETQKFMGLFNHKLIAQYVDASLSYNLPIRYEVENENHYLNILHALNGYISNQHSQPQLDDYFAEFAGLMQGQNNTAHALKTMLTCILKQDVHVKEFVEEKFKLPKEQQTALGGVGCSLGVNTFCGESIRQIDGKIEIQIGPLSYSDYLKYLPQQEKSSELKGILASWCSPTLLIDLRLILAKEAIQPLKLSSSSQIGLGQGAFLQPEHVLDNKETCYTIVGNTLC